MINDIIKHSLRFILLVLVQVLVIQNINLGSYINPFLYVFFILSLPFEISGGLLLFISFLLGISIDLFYDTIGMHASASVFMAFCRPTVLKLFSPRDGYDSNMQPSIPYLGMSWYLSYAGVLIILHHLVLFYVEVFRFSNFFGTFFKVLMSSFFTLLIIIITQLLFYKQRDKI